jgi:hypothetical protein
MYVCMYVLYVRTNVGMYVWMYVCMYIQKHTYREEDRHRKISFGLKDVSMHSDITRCKKLIHGEKDTHGKNIFWIERHFNAQ